MNAVSYDAPEVTQPKKGGRPAWKDRPGQGRKLYTVWLYDGQLEWLKANGGAERLRAMLDRAMNRRSAAVDPTDITD